MDTRFSELLENNPVASKRLFKLNQQILSEAVGETRFSSFMERVLSILQRTFGSEEVMIITGPADKRTCYRLTDIEGNVKFSSIYNVPQINSLKDAEASFKKKRFVYRSFRKEEARKCYSHFSPLKSGSKRIGTLAIAASSDLFSDDDCALIDMIADTLTLAMVSFENRAALRERVKELTCLYKTAQLFANPALSICEIFREVVTLLPPA